MIIIRQVNGFCRAVILAKAAERAGVVPHNKINSFFIFRLLNFNGTARADIFAHMAGHAGFRIMLDLSPELFGCRGIFKGIFDGGRAFDDIVEYDFQKRAQAYPSSEFFLPDFNRHCDAVDDCLRPRRTPRNVHINRDIGIKLGFHRVTLAENPA